MEEITEIPPALTFSHKSLLFNIPLDHASTASALRPCLELARTCVIDLEELIKLCNESLALLRTKPAVFRRTNNVIESARNQVLQVCRLLERMTTSGGRPGSSASQASGVHHNGLDGGGRLHVSFKNRWGRLSTDARDLINVHQPLVAKEQSAVITELNVMRQLVLLAPAVINGPVSGPAAGTAGGQNGQSNRSKTTVWNNMGLLDEMIGGGGGGGGVNRIPEHQQQQQQQQQQSQRYGSPIPRPGSGDYLLLPPPYPGTPESGSKPKPLPTLHHSSSSLSLLSNAPVPRPSTNASSSTLTLWSNTSDPTTAFQELPGVGVTSQPPNHFQTRAASNSVSKTVFDSVGIGLLYGDGDRKALPKSTSELSGYGRHQSSTSELPGAGRLNATATTNTLIYNQHTHNHTYQCYHHHRDSNHISNPNHDRTGGMAQQQQQQQLPPQYMVAAINEGQPQELSCVVSDHELVELP